jgi:hypothetical protein
MSSLPIESGGIEWIRQTVRPNRVWVIGVNIRNLVVQTIEIDDEGPEKATRGG